jgi:phosphoglycerol transferase MdoB-like AlkP superfamily enzyme
VGKIKQLYVVLYFVLNVLVTYLVTLDYFNPNIVSFKLPFINHVFCVIGNFAILLLLLFIGKCLFKKERCLFKYIITITFLLNFFIFLIGYFTRNFKAMLSFHNLTLFRNPDAGFAKQIVIDGLGEMLRGWELLCFIPFIVLLLFYLLIRRKVREVKHYRIRFLFILLLTSLILSISSIMYFNIDVNKNWKFRSEYSLYGVSTCGIYNYYFSELVLGMDYNEEYYLKSKESSSDLSSYNKLEQDYGVYSGMNLFVIQAEALSSFVIDLEYDNKLITPYLSSLLLEDDVFFFPNVNTVVGMGNTSDAEFAFNTGYYPLGDLTIVWEAKDRLFEIGSLPKMFKDYICYAYNPTIEGFYAHKYVFENLYKFDEFKGFETHNKLYPYEKNTNMYLQKKWVSDEAILNLALADSKKVLDENKNFYVFAQTITPHYPFVDLDYYKEFDCYDFKNLDKKFNNYLNQIHYIDKVLYDFLSIGKEALENTVFLIYGDHGNTLPKEGFEEVLGRKLTDLEYRKLLLEIPVIIYDPSGKLTNYLSVNEIDVDYNRVLSQIDLFQTVGSLFSLERENHLGVNIFSNNKSFVVEPKGLDIITDDFFYSMKNAQYKIYSDISYLEMINEVSKISEFKLASDIYLTKKINN